MRYFPLLRGKRGELRALKELSLKIAEHGKVVPIIEPVNNNDPNSNQNPLKAFSRFVSDEMPFMLICNPIHGDFVDDPIGLNQDLIGDYLLDYPGWIPAMYVKQDSTSREIEEFREYHHNRDCALIYYKTSYCRSLGEFDLEDYRYHVFDERTAEIDFIESLPASRRIRLTDPFIRQRANADYRAVPSEKFSEWHLPTYNKLNEDFGDFSVQGDHFLSVGGNTTKTVAIHHIHYPEGRDSGTLYVTHFLSNRIHTAADRTGKTLEAIRNLCSAMSEIAPTDTMACDVYRFKNSKNSGTSLEVLKRLSIQHHLEVILGDEGL